MHELPLSIAQEGLWYLARLDETASAAYNMVFAFAASRPIDRALLARTLAVLQARHEILRARVQADDGPPRLVVADAADAPAIDVVEVVDALEGIAHDESARPFDLTRAPLMRVTLVRADDGTEGLVLTLPHLVFDGASATLFFEEWTAIAAQLACGESPAREVAPSNWAEVVRRERAWAASTEGHAAMDDALARLAGLPARLALPRAAMPAPGQLVHRASVLEFFIDPELATRLRELARAARATAAAAYAGAFELLLWRSSGQRDFALTLPVMHRHPALGERALGYLTNLGVLRATIEAGASVADFLGAVTDALFDMLETRELPFPLLAQRLKRDRREVQLPLMQLGFNHESARGEATRLGDCELQPVEVPPMWAKNELKLDVLETADGGARCWLLVDREGWGDEDVDAMAVHYLALLAAMADDPTRRIDELPMAASSPAEA